MTPSEIRRLTGYPVFYIGASMFIYFLVTSGIYPYLPNIVDQFSPAGLLSGIYLKVLYALLCLLVGVAAQFILIGKTTEMSCVFSRFSIWRISGFYSPAWPL